LGAEEGAEEGAEGRVEGVGRVWRDVFGRVVAGAGRGLAGLEAAREGTILGMAGLGLGLGLGLRLGLGLGLGLGLEEEEEEEEEFSAMLIRHDTLSFSRCFSAA
jgi:hypothetical protein